VTAIEYDKEPSMGNSNLWPWQIFAALTSVPSPGIQLNWQAKLVPVTEKRLKDSMSLAPGARGRHFKWRPERLESGMKKALKAYYEGVILYTKDLDTH